MTPQEAAKACMARVYGPLKDWLTPSALAETERAFLEIISQVAPTPLSVAAARALLWREGMDGAGAMRRAMEAAQIAIQRRPMMDLPGWSVAPTMPNDKMVWVGARWPHDTKEK